MITKVVNEDLLFFTIEQIFIAETNVKFCIRNLNTVRFCEHFHAYEVEYTSNYRVVNIEKLSLH